MEVFVEVYTQNYQIFYMWYGFFTSGGGDDEVLGTFLLIEQVIKDASSMYISFRVKHSQTFWESWMSLSNMSRTITVMYRCPFKQQLVIKT